MRSIFCVYCIICPNVKTPFANVFSDESAIVWCWLRSRHQWLPLSTSTTALCPHIRFSLQSLVSYPSWLRCSEKLELKEWIADCKEEILCFGQFIPRFEAVAHRLALQRRRRAAVGPMLASFANRVRVSVALHCLDRARPQTAQATLEWRVYFEFVTHFPQRRPAGKGVFKDDFAPNLWQIYEFALLHSQIHK